MITFCTSCESVIKLIYSEQLQFTHISMLDIDLNLVCLLCMVSISSFTTGKLISFLPIVDKMAFGRMTSWLKGMAPKELSLTFKLILPHFAAKTSLPELSICCQNYKTFFFFVDVDPGNRRACLFLANLFSLVQSLKVKPGAYPRGEYPQSCFTRVCASLAQMLDLAM